MASNHPDLMLFQTPDMNGNQPATVVDADTIGLTLDFNLLADIGERYRISVGLKIYHTVFSHMPYGPNLQDISRFAGMVDQESPFFCEHLSRFPMSSAVDPLIGHIGCPYHQRVIEMVKRGKLFPSEKTFYILNARLHFAFRLRPVNTMSQSAVPVVAAEIPKNRVPLNAAAVKIPGKDYCFGIIIIMCPTSLCGLSWEALKETFEIGKEVAT